MTVFPAGRTVVDRERVRRDAEFWTSRPRSAQAVDQVANERQMGRHCLALLAELEQAEERESVGATNFLVQLDLRKAAEARLARVPALVGALKDAVRLLDAALAEWEQA